MNLDISQWKEFKVSAIFTIHNGKGITKEEIEDNEGDFIVVQSGEENNGVLGKINRNYCKKMKYTFSDKPCLTVARSGSAGFVSFQVKGCVVGDSAKILLLDDRTASVELYLFLQTILSANRFKYAYGRKVTEKKYMSDVIKLPVEHKEDGTIFIDSSKKYSPKGYVPDWTWMENYIRSLHYKPLLTKNRRKQALNLDIDNWYEFKINALFTMQRGHTLSADDKEVFVGNIPCVNGTISDNGVLCKVSDDIQQIGFVKVKAPALSLVRVGNGGKTFVQTEDFYVADNAFALKTREDLPKEILFFISVLLDVEQVKYSYGRTVTSDYVNTVIKLPIKHNLDGKPYIDLTYKYSSQGYIPDWKWMETYIKALPYGDKL